MQTNTTAFDLYLRAWALANRPEHRHDLGAGTSREYAAVALAARDAKSNIIRSKSEVEAEIDTLLGGDQ